jgi:hypothetical protein
VFRCGWVRAVYMITQHSQGGADEKRYAWKGKLLRSSHLGSV